MKTLEKVSDFVGKYMAAIVIVVAAGALFFPGPFSVVKTAWVNNLLGIVMFGMGLTLKPEDFKVVFSRPKDVIVGCVAQFTLMPFLAWALTQVFHLPTELAIGVILVGTCPGGTSSNVMTCPSSRWCWCPSHWALWSITSSISSPRKPSVCCLWSPLPPSC